MVGRASPVASIRSLPVIGPPARKASSTADAVIRRSINDVGVDLCMRATHGLTPGWDMGDYRRNDYRP